MLNRLVKLISLLALVGVCVTVNADDTKPVFRKLPAETIELMDKQRSFVATLVQKHLPGEKLTKTKSDLAVIQKLLDAKIISKERTWELQSLGIVFGDVLAGTIDGLAWWEIMDEYGTDPTLRYKETTLQINALTMISKRIENGEECDVARMAAWVADFVKNKSHEYK